MKAIFCSLLVVTLAAAQERNRVAVLQIEVENSVLYRYDVADVAQRATRAGPTPTPADRAFQDFCQIDDIVAVNGKPAKGLHMTCGTRMGFNPTPAAGFGIADVAIGAGRQECNWELYTAEGKFVGRLVDGGFFPHSLQGGAGAYFGVTGEHHFEQLTPNRIASVGEDPGQRRMHGGGKYRVVFYVVPRYWPEVVRVMRGDLQNPAADPLRPGDVVTLMVKGLGPTVGGLSGPLPPGSRPFASGEPYDVVNSPLEVTINGVAVEVMNQIGWPGSLDSYRVDIRVPAGIGTGTAKLVVSSAWIPSDAFEVRVRE